MAFALTTDPIVPFSDFKAMLGLTEDQPAILALNAVSQKARRFMNRPRLLYVSNASAIVEQLAVGYSPRLYLHAPVKTGQGFTVTAVLYDGALLEQSLSLANGDFTVYSDDYCSYLDRGEVGWWGEEASESGLVLVTYNGGWTDVPADVAQGALLQARVDINRMKGLVGQSSHSVSGETISYDNAGIVREVADMWRPYRVMV